MTEPWGDWNRQGRRDPASALTWCDNIIGCLNRAAEHEKDRLWHKVMDAYLVKRDELREKFGIKAPAAPLAPAVPAKQLDLLGI